MGDKERPDELAGDSGQRWLVNEVEESVEPKDQENEAEKETSDDRNNFHGNIFCLI